MVRGVQIEIKLARIRQNTIHRVKRHGVVGVGGIDLSLLRSGAHTGWVVKAWLLRVDHDVPRNARGRLMDVKLRHGHSAGKFVLHVEVYRAGYNRPRAIAHHMEKDRRRARRAVRNGWRIVGSQGHRSKWDRLYRLSHQPGCKQ